MALFRVILTFIMFAAFLVGCDFPPQEVADIQEQLQSQISRGQVYVTHSDNGLSFMIKNSELTRRPEAEKEKLVSKVEKEALEFLAKYQNYQYIRIYFIGEGTAGIDKPYICQSTFNACLKAKEQGKP